MIRVERGEVEDQRHVAVGEAKIPVDAPEVVLLMLPLSVLREQLDEVALWLKSLVVSRPALAEAYRLWPRPVVLKRMEHLARDVGNDRLADVLRGIVREEQRVRIGRDRTGVGRTLVVPSLVARAETTRQPWLDRLRVAILGSREQVGEALSELGGAVAPEDLTLEERLAEARRARAYDAYHSSSIEGYRLSLDEVSALLAGGSGETVIADVRSKLAAIGYGVAFDNLLARLEAAGGGIRPTGDLALDLYVDLFTPSVEAGIVAAEDLRGWRTGAVFIRDTLFVPPGAEKVPRMIDLLFDEISDIEATEGLLRAVLIHLWFVWIHPFPDGNGRVARFLMNAVLLGGGLPWLTLRVEQRVEYFAALRRAQLEGDPRPFAELIVRSMRHPRGSYDAYQNPG